MVDQSELLTKGHLDARLDEFLSHIERDLGAIGTTVDRRLRIQTWITSCLLITGVLLAFSAGRIV